MLIRSWDRGDEDEWRAWLAEGRDFGLLAANGGPDEGPVLVPTHFLLDAGRGEILLHLATPNPLLAAVRAALAEPLERRDRVEHVLDTYLAGIEARPQVYRLLTHPEPGDPSGAGNALAPALRQIAEEITHAVQSQVDLGADRDLLAEVWGRGITGMVLAAGDWWLETRPCSRTRMVQALADLLWGRLAAAADLPTAVLPAAPAEPPSPEAT